MPVRRGRKMRRPVRRARFTRRKVNRRMRRRGKNLAIMPTKLILKKGTGMPDKFFVKLRYQQSANFQSSSITAMEAFFYGNLPWDPDALRNLNQVSALEFNTFAAVYRWCRCFGSKIVVRAVVNNTNSTSMVITPATSQQSFPYDNRCVDKRSRQSRFGVNSGNSSMVVKNYCTTKAIFGLKHRLNDNEHEYDFNTVTHDRPIYPWFWHILFQEGAALTAPLNVSCTINITYYCEFFEKIPLPYNLADTDDDPGATGPSAPETNEFIVYDEDLFLP